MKQITIKQIDNFFEDHKELSYLKDNIVNAIEILSKCTISNKILTCGNGGSAADSEHIAGELLKSFMLKRKISLKLKDELINKYGEEGDFIANNIQGGLKCIPLTSFSAFNTAFLNDCNGEMSFAQLVNALGDKDDVLIAISTSGNSKNVCYAAQLAKVKGLKVVALTGSSGGKLKQIADILINVPSNIVYKIQEMHIQIYHLLCLGIESERFDI